MPSAESVAVITAEEPVVEKAKKQKKDKKDKKEKKEKKKSKTKDVETPDVADATNGETVVSDGPEAEEKRKKKEKKERKKEKKDKKEKKKKAKQVEDNTQNGTETEDTPMVDATAQESNKKSSKKKRKHDQVAEDAADSTNAADSESRPKKSKKEGKARNGVESNGAANGHAASGDTYTQSAALDAVPQSEIDDFLKSKFVAIADPTGKLSHLRPIVQFSHLPTTRLLEKSPFKAFSAPTPIQAASWPFTLSHRDVIGVAETGSGKTMAFALPCVEGLLRGPKKRGVKAVVVSPTRELAMQTQEQVSQLAGLVGLSCVCIYGGAPKHEQRALLGRGADIIVATPGRLKDFMSEGVCDLSNVQFVVLDEADRMLDTGFEEDIKQILAATPPREKRQTLMFTATWPVSVQALAASMMVDPVKITISNGADDRADGELQANKRITQRVEVVDPRAKEGRLLQILREYQQGSKRNDRILVFCLYKKEATRVEETLSRKGIRVAGIHGDLKQEQRTRSLEAFKAGTTSVLVATDVAARGLDIPEVKLVINLTFPLTIEDYVHRIGRTGRAGKTGEAITLFTLHDKSHSGELINILKQAGQPVPEDLLKFGTTVKKKLHPVYGAFYREVDTTNVPAKIVFDD
ncbi:ATP-dependent RNA helicase dbp3 [Scedosporium apiospermum]|uniref:RNA helicase n=1 Tax=Pseudallescheria apiosperma TaxID=563466 RepID=A0A084FZT2_PSEDA|nr:ATP-dependent RNA helicase dbp3 [Scedosporium apiospermum]KEZ40594.1 ATP-dependent RNA helicase dbp3 [Scedosporium apiospermum]